MKNYGVMRGVGYYKVCLELQRGQVRLVKNMKNNVRIRDAVYWILKKPKNNRQKRI